jgi:hypothetical protein
MLDSKRTVIIELDDATIKEAENAGNCWSRNVFCGSNSQRMQSTQVMFNSHTVKFIDELPLAAPGTRPNYGNEVK